MSVPDNQFALFNNDCATACEAYAACGGSRATAPCGCAWPWQSGMRYQCQKCYLICREKRRASAVPGQLGELDFARNFEQGYLLDQVALRQAPPPLPLLIPTYTQKCKGPALPLRWAAADMRVLFNSRRKGPAALQPHFASEAQARAYLNVPPSCQLLAVLNGQDWMLESFWGMPRQATLNHLADIGFGLGTGPTFSLTALTTKRTKVPYSHHAAMLTRHHRVADEMQDAGICVAPNLYWLDNDQRELHRWADWLQANPSIGLVSRDFTDTVHWSVIQPKVAELLYLLRKAGRAFHVLVVGSGRANGPRILKALASEGHTASIVTSAPILKALKGVRYDLDSAGNSTEASCDPIEYPYARLIEHNIAVFEKILFQAVVGTSAAQTATFNLRQLMEAA